MRRDCLFVKSPTILRCVGEVDNPNAPSSVVEVDHSEILGLNNKHLANRVHVALTPVYAELLELGVVRVHGNPQGVDQLLQLSLRLAHDHGLKEIDGLPRSRRVRAPRG